MRIAAMAGAALLLTGLLAGCNGIISTKPLFFTDDARGQPQPRPGVWMAETTDCPFDPGLAVDLWPSCSDGFVVRPGAIVTGRDPGSPPASWTVYPIVLAKADPAVLQITADDHSGAPPSYLYAGVRPLKLDAQGRIIEYKAWPALCGPPPPADSTGEHDATTTQQPIDGLVMEPAKHDCVASAQAPVRISVRESEVWSGDDDLGRDRARWVRDGER